MLTLRPILPVLALAASLAQAAPLYRVVALATPPGVVVSIAGGLNDHGVVVGVASEGPVSYAVAWTVDGQTMRRLPGDVVAGFASAINNAGVIVGSGTLNQRPQAILWDIDGSVTGLGKLPGGVPRFSGSLAYDINDAGTVVGLTYVGGLPRPSKNGDFAFRRPAGGPMQPLPDLPGGLDFTTAYGINAVGDIAGYASVQAPGGGKRNRAVLWRQDGSLLDLGVLQPTDASAAYDVNNQGLAVGQSGVRPVWWTAATGLQDLGLLPGRSNARATAVNDAGQVIGLWDADAAPFRGSFYWEPGAAVRDLVELVDPTDPLWPLLQERVEVSQINALGQIAATIGGVVSPQRAVLLLPVPSARGR